MLFNFTVAMRAHGLRSPVFADWGEPSVLRRDRMTVAAASAVFLPYLIASHR